MQKGFAGGMHNFGTKCMRVTAVWEHYSYPIWTERF